jgi:hypothetical protein
MHIIELIQIDPITNVKYYNPTKSVCKLIIKDHFFGDPF